MTLGVFSDLWKTDKLLTSIDSIAIGRPPEDGEEPFYSPEQQWLHVDQSAAREGVHAYQGAVYLETADDCDWTFCVMETSHLHLADFYINDERSAIRSSFNNYCPMREDAVEWFKNKGCNIVRVAAPKGSMVLWDSRLVHANARPIQDRKHPRWRYCVFVCMTPAIWANDEDMLLKKSAYNDVLMTSHWASQGIRTGQKYQPSGDIFYDSLWTTKLPNFVKNSSDVQRLCGKLRYNFKDGRTNGPDWRPKWNKNYEHVYKKDFSDRIQLSSLTKCVAVGGVFVVIIAIGLYKFFIVNRIDN